ncbi:MAG: DUF4352 domain-containing protein [Dehalococcoidia bacterium]|nr:DUF4352 domain-containing protein [Dehalococcoidia bacterium]
METGASATGGGFRLTLLAIADPVPTRGETADEGHRFIGYQFLVENVSRDVLRFYSFEFQVTDSNNYAFDTAYAFTDLRDLDDCPRTFNPSAKCEGWILFEVREDSSVALLSFEASSDEMINFRR